MKLSFLPIFLTKLSIYSSAVKRRKVSSILKYSFFTFRGTAISYVDLSAISKNFLIKVEGLGNPINFSTVSRQLSIFY